MNIVPQQFEYKDFLKNHFQLGYSALRDIKKITYPRPH